ncbi:MAG: GH3 auxin-responsive promoter, partial [Deltaproteobacteria bacterium]|nr:GH3 auxin-responsive promoter [Deltaproteobacteria bacterium]
MRRLLFYVLRWMAWPFARRFRGALENPRGAQANVLAAITAELRQTDYGKHLGVETTEDFRKKVPVVDYDDLAPWIEKQKKFESGALIATKVLFYEKTSGSTGPAKYIPYTKALRTSFTRMFLVWAY